MKNLTFTVLLSFCTMMSFCQNSKNNPEKGLLWKISGYGLTEKSYLFGTWHGSPGVCIDFLDSIPGFYKAFDSVTQYVGENKGDKDTQDALTSHLGEIWMPQDITYKDMLNERDIQFLDSILRIYIDPTSSTSTVNVRPNHLYYYLVSTISHKPYFEAENEKCKIIMDSYLLVQAMEKYYLIYGLDTPDILRRLGTNLYLPKSDSDAGIEEQADYVIREIEKLLSQEENTEMKSILEKMENAYRNMDLNNLTKYKNESIDIIKNLQLTEPDFDENYHFMVIGRNKVWMETIPELINKQPSFIAVGALHLPGEEGLINLLRKEGYTVNPVN